MNTEDINKIASIAAIILQNTVEMNRRLQELLQVLQNTDTLPAETFASLQAARRAAVEQFNNAFNSDA